MTLGILDQLKKEVESKKQSVVEDAELAQRREQTYQKLLLPTMQRLLKSVQELLEYLKEMDPVEVADYSVARPEIGKLVQHDYRLSTDGKSGFTELSKLMQIDLSCRLKGIGPYKYEIIGKLAAEGEQDFLYKRGIKYDTTTKLVESGVPVTTFVIERNIPVTMRFEIDHNASCIKFTEWCYENFSTSTQTFQVAELNFDLIDQFLRFLLRKDTDFASRLKRRFPTRDSLGIH